MEEASTITQTYRCGIYRIWMKQWWRVCWRTLKLKWWCFGDGAKVFRNRTRKVQWGRLYWRRRKTCELICWCGWYYSLEKNDLPKKCKDVLREFRKKASNFKITNKIEAAIRNMELFYYWFNVGTHGLIDIIAQNYSRASEAKLTNKAEIEALLGLYVAGLLNANHSNTNELWLTDESGLESFL